MLPAIEEKLDALRALCKKYDARNLYLFGSALSGRLDAPPGDLDFLVDFMPAGKMDVADQYFGLLRELEGLFQCPVDLVMTRAMKNPYFIEAVERRKRLLYAA